MHRTPIDTHIARVHHPAFAAVERELELAFDHNAVIDRQGAMERRLDSGREINQADYGAVADVDSWLFFFQRWSILLTYLAP